MMRFVKILKYIRFGMSEQFVQNWLALICLVVVCLYRDWWQIKWMIIKNDWERRKRTKRKKKKKTRRKEKKGKQHISNKK